MSYLQALNAGALTQSTGPAVTNTVSIMQRQAPTQICPNGNPTVYDWAGPYEGNYPDTTGLTYDFATKRFTNSNAYNVLVIASYTLGFECISTTGYRASYINVSGSIGQQWGYNIWVPAPLDFEEQVVNASTSFVLAPGAYFTTVVLQNSGVPIPMSLDAFATFVVVKI